MNRFVRRATAPALLAMTMQLLAVPLRAAELDFDYLPAGSVAGVVVRPARALRSSATELYPKEVIVAAGLEYAGFDPTKIETAWGFSGIPLPPSGVPAFGIVLSFSEPVDRATVVAKLADPAGPQKAGEQEFHLMRDPELPAFYFPDERTIVLAPAPVLRQMMSIHAKPVSSRLGELLRQVDERWDAAVVVDFAAVRPLVLLGMNELPPIPPQFEQFLEAPQYVSTIRAAIALSGEQGLELIVGADNEKGAERLRELGEAAKQMAVDMIASQAASQLGDSNDPVQLASLAYSQRVTKAMINWLQLRQEGADVRFELEGAGTKDVTFIAVSGVLVALLLPAVQAAREAARRAQSSNNMKQLGLGLHIYHDAMKKFPAPAITDKSGRPLLSWRVALLPFLEEQALYEQFHLDEPWDSEHNRQLIAKMPAVFQNPNSPTPLAEGLTNYLLVTGPGALFSLTKPRLAECTDGLSNTIVMVEADADQAVEWTRPADLETSSENPLQGLGGLRPNGFNALFGDGSVQFIASSIDADILRALFSAQGGERIDR